MTSSLARVVQAVELLAAHPRGLSVTELAEMMDTNKSTASRLLAAMVRDGLVERDEGQRHALDLRFWTWGVQASRRLAFLEVARPHIAAVVKEWSAQVHVAVVRGGQAVYLESTAPTSKGDTITRAVSPVLPVYACAPGKAVLAYADEESVEAVLRSQMTRFTPRTLASREELEAELEDIRRQGYAINRGEYYDNGLLAVAVPIFDQSRAPIAAVCFSRLPDEETLERLLKPLLELGDTISVSLGYGLAARDVVG